MPGFGFVWKYSTPKLSLWDCHILAISGQTHFHHFHHSLVTSVLLLFQFPYLVVRVPMFGQKKTSYQVGYIVISHQIFPYDSPMLYHSTTTTTTIVRWARVQIGLWPWRRERRARQDRGKCPGVLHGRGARERWVLSFKGDFTNRNGKGVWHFRVILAGIWWDKSW